LTLAALVVLDELPGVFNPRAGCFHPGATARILIFACRIRLH
jgi:hypothetical protein